MAFKKGDKKPEKSGRTKGTPNQLTKTVKEAFEFAFNELQKDEKANLVAWGIKNPSYFYPLAAKLIPTELKANLEGKIINVNPPDDK